MRPFLLFTIVFAFKFVVAQTSTFNSIKGSVEFDYISEKTTGTMSDAEISLVLSDNLDSCLVEGRVAVASLNTGNNMRDKHLKSKDFFHVDKFECITFKSKQWEPNDHRFFITGELTIKGITKEVGFDMVKEENGFVFTGNIYATDFDVAIKKDRNKSKVRIVVILPLSE